MSYKESRLKYAHLDIMKSGRSILYLHSSYNERIQVELPPYLTRVLKGLFQHYFQLGDLPEKDIDGFISAKELAIMIHVSLNDIYDVRSYIGRIRKIILQDCCRTGKPYKSFKSFILSKKAWGYRIHPDVKVSIKEL